MSIFIKTVLARFGYTIQRSPSDFFAKQPNLLPALTPYQSCVLSLLAVKESLTIVVIGANDGKFNDPIYELIRDHIAEKTRVFLFEPQMTLHKVLSENYSYHKDTHVLPYAIGPGKELSLFAVKEEYWAKCNPRYAKGWPAYRAPTGITSSDRAKVLSWIRTHSKGIADPESAIEELSVPVRTLSDALAEKGFPPAIDVLQVDVEGFDDSVLYHSNIASTQPSLILFEAKNLAEQRLAKVITSLEHLNYVPIRAGGDVLCIKRSGPTGSE